MKTETIKIVPIAEFKRELAKLVAKHGSASKAARAMGAFPANISQVLCGKNMPSKELQEYFGIEVRKVIVQRPAQ